MINIAEEKLLTVKEARRELPNRPSINTVYRWLYKGVQGVRLDSIRIGGRVFTSREACYRFIHARSQRHDREKQALADRVAVRQAQRFLELSGVGPIERPCSHAS